MNEFGMSGDDLEQMYQEVILEASKHPHGKESFAPNAAVEQSADAAANVTVQASHEYCTPGESHQFNPTCGDEATIHVEVSDDEPQSSLILLSFCLSRFSTSSFSVHLWQISTCTLNPLVQPTGLVP